MFCTAGYNARRQRVLAGKTPDLIVAERLTAKPALAKDKPAGRARSCDITKARLIADRAKEAHNRTTRAASARAGSQKRLQLFVFTSIFTRSRSDANGICSR